VAAVTTGDARVIDDIGSEEDVRSDKKWCAHTMDPITCHVVMCICGLQIGALSAIQAHRAHHN
jgi:hypothetical protein